MSNEGRETRYRKCEEEKEKEEEVEGEIEEVAFERLQCKCETNTNQQLFQKAKREHPALLINDG